MKEKNKKEKGKPSLTMLLEEAQLKGALKEKKKKILGTRKVLQILFTLLPSS